MPVPDKDSTVELIQYGGGGEHADAEGHVGENAGHAGQRQDNGANRREESRPTEISEYTLPGCPPPGQQRSNSHHQDERQEKQAVGYVIEGLSHRHGLAPECCREDGKDRAPERRKRYSGQQPVVQEEAALDRKSTR